jgi:hypothetical protein
MWRLRARYNRPTACDAPGRAGRCGDPARTALPTATPCPRRQPPRTPRHTDPPPAQDGAPPGPPRARTPGAGDTTPIPGGGMGASTGERLTPTTPAPYAGGGSRSTRPCARASRSGQGAARPPPGASSAVGRGTGWGSGADHGDTRRVAWGSPAWSAFSPGHAGNNAARSSPTPGFRRRR